MAESGVHIFEFPLIGGEMLECSGDDTIETVMKRGVPTYDVSRCVMVQVPLSDEYAIFYDLTMSTTQNIPYNEAWEIFVRQIPAPAQGSTSAAHPTQ